MRFYLFFDHSKMWKLIKVACYFFQSKFHIAGYGTMTVLSFDHELRTLFLIKMFINNNNNQLIQIIDNAV